MLVLTREFDQWINVECDNGKRIEIVVVEIRGDRVKLGIQAPAEFVITRPDMKDRRPAA